ncbi:ice-binding family protein [Streptosporangium sp. 'caverna']|uniref:ice-binding family protein n=1 Tax=Streptosporangium sp. 'caverna' TaxID=2202249 RepID=UPI0019550778|nr:ice-binding family protein [Streptosporangium sp. 'caverna']
MTPHTASAAARAPVAVALGTAANFAILAGKAVVNTGSTVVTGDLGVSPSASVSGFPPGSVSGATHAANAVAAQAQADLTTAYNNADTQAPATTVPTQLGGTTLGPGIYKSTAGTFQITGNLTLDAQGDPNAVFIFQTASSLSTGTASTVTLTGGAQECNVFWKVGSSAALGTNSSFTGNILALNSISAGGGAAVKGRALARTGLVTLNKSTVTPSVCQAPSDVAQASSGTAEVPPGAMQADPCLPGQGGQFAFTIPVDVLSTAIPPGSVAFFGTGPLLGGPQFDATGQVVPTAADPCQDTGQGAVAPGAATPGTATPGTGAETPGTGAPDAPATPPGTGAPGEAPGPDAPGTPPGPGAPGTAPGTPPGPGAPGAAPSTPGTGAQGPDAPGAAPSTPGTAAPGTGVGTPGMSVGMGAPGMGGLDFSTSPMFSQSVVLFGACVPWGC